MSQFALQSHVTLGDLLFRHYPIRECILSRIGSMGFESLASVFPGMLEETCVGNDFEFFTIAIPEFCFANGTNPLIYELIYPIVCYLSTKVPFSDLYDMLHHLHSNYMEIGVTVCEGDLRSTMLRTLRDATKRFLKYDFFTREDPEMLWEEDLERVKCMSVTYLHDFDLTQVKEEFLNCEVPLHCARYSKCFGSGANWWEFKGCCHEDLSVNDPCNFLRYPSCGEGHTCSLEDGLCQTMYRSVTRGAKPPVVEFAILCHLIKKHLSSWVMPVMKRSTALWCLGDMGGLFHQGLNLVYFLENTNFLCLVKEYIVCNVVRG